MVRFRIDEVRRSSQLCREEIRRGQRRIQPRGCGVLWDSRDNEEDADAGDH